MNKFITQKTQKIVSALYLITDIIKDNDIMKWEIREEGVLMVSKCLMIDTSFPVEKDHATKLFLASLEKVILFLNISQTSFLISKMNTSIVIAEIESLIHFITKENKENSLPGYILSDNFFAQELESKNDKGQDLLLKTFSKDDSKIMPKSSDRKDSIIGLLKKDSNLTIKDFTKVIKDCSEKTIQRELISLVKKGVVKRMGERRWSTYSLS